MLQRAKSGDKNAFGEIYKIYYKKIYRYCRINLRSDETAQDISQETFLKAWKALPTFSTGNGSSVQAFLFRIARNLIIDLSRKKKLLPLDTALEVATDEDIEGDLEKSEDMELVRRALDKLDPEDRQIIVLRYFEELPTAEIAEVLGVNDGNLRVKLHRILKKLKEILND